MTAHARLKTILAIGGTGRVGGEVVRALRARDAEVRIMTRDPSKVTEGVAGDLAEPESLREALDGVDRVWLLTPLARDEARLGINAVEAATDAGVERLVFQSVHQADAAPGIPHFASKVAIQGAIRASGLAFTVISPNSFQQNDRWLRQPILEHGIYPQPIGSVGVSRVDTGDIAAATARVLLEDGWEGEDVPLVGPHAWTGEETAAVYAALTGRDVRYSGDELDAWGETARTMMPDWLVDDLRTMYAHFQAHGLAASEADLAATRRVVGREPRRFESYAEELVSEWRAS